MSRAIGICLTVIFMSCSGKLVHLDPDEFIKMGSTIEEMNSATATRYIGHTQERVYLEYFSALTSGNDKTTVYWTELSKLPLEYQQKIRRGDCPWLPWQKECADPAHGNDGLDSMIHKYQHGNR